MEEPPNSQVDQNAAEERDEAPRSDGSVAYRIGLMLAMLLLALAALVVGYYYSR